jgi:hypothetical protein
MKKIILITTLNVLLALDLSAQSATIKAERAKFHITENVTIIDSITSVIVKNDSTTIINIGSRTGKNQVLVMLKFPFYNKQHGDLSKTLKYSLLEVKGTLSVTGENPVITVYNQDNLYFYSPALKQQWALSAERTVKKLR